MLGKFGLQEKTLKDFDRSQMANVPEFKPNNAIMRTDDLEYQELFFCLMSLFF